MIFKRIRAYMTEAKTRRSVAKLLSGKKGRSSPIKLNRAQRLTLRIGVPIFLLLVISISTLKYWYHPLNLWASKINPTTLEFWKTVATVFVALIAAAITAVIQYRQVTIADAARKIAAHKLRLDLFDKRLAIYDACVAAYDQAFVGEFSGTATNAYFQASGEARWLFGDEVAAFMHSSYGHLNGWSNRIAAANGKYDSIHSLVDIERNHFMSWFHTEHRDERRTVFAKYLKMGADTVDVS